MGIILLLCATPAFSSLIPAVLIVQRTVESQLNPNAYYLGTLFGFVTVPILSVYVPHARHAGEDLGYFDVYFEIVFVPVIVAWLVAGFVFVCSIKYPKLTGLTVGVLIGTASIPIAALILSPALVDHFQISQHP